MNQSLEDKLKTLERKIAVKNAYLTVQFSFPKGNRIPEDVKNQVVNELKNACAMLADDTALDSNKQNEHLTDEEIIILKQVVSSVKSKSGTTPTARADQPAPNTSSNNLAAEPVEPPPPKVPLPKKTFDSAVDGIKKAAIITLENVDPKYRSRINSDEMVFVSSIREDGFARISVQRTGLSINVPVEDLDFNVKQ